MSDLPKRAATLEELSATVRSAAEAGIRLRFAGSDSMPLTRFDGTARPVHALSLLRMNKLIEHAVGDMTVIVEAGITLEALQRQLAWHEQWLPVDPPILAQNGGTPGQRTLGGLIASNSLGPLRFGCGDWRLFIMGMKWVDAAGRVIKGGSRTVKNVAGYSTPRLMIGSCGSLGAIAQLTLRTFSRPADERCALFFCDNPASAEALLAAIMLSPTTPAYIQVIGARTFAGNPLQLPAPRGEHALVVAVGFLGRPETCAAQIETVRGLSAAAGMETISQPAAQCGRLRLWMTTEPALDPRSPGAGFRIHAKSSDAAAMVDALESAADPAAPAWVVSEAGTGIIRGLIQGTATPTKITGIAQRAAASILWTQGITPVLSTHPLADRIKRELDPNALFGDAPA